MAEQQVKKSFSLGELAAIAEGELIQGDPAQVIHGVAEIDKAADGQITYAVSEKYSSHLEKTQASAVVVPLDLKIHVGKPLIKAENPYWSFAKILEIFSPAPPAPEAPVHPSAVVHPTAELGEGVVIGPNVTVDAYAAIGAGTTIGPGSFVGHRAVIGEGCEIFPNVTVHRECVVGDRVVIQSGTVVGGDGYGFVLKAGQHYKIPQIGNVVIGDDVEIGSCVTIDRATIGQTRIEAGVKIDNLVQIGHNVVVGRNSLLVSQVGISGSTEIGANTRFAGQSAAAGHLKIGDNTTVAARGAVTKDLADNSFVSGFPAKPHSQEKRIVAAMNRLPQLVKRVAALERQLAKATEGDPAPHDDHQE